MSLYFCDLDIDPIFTNYVTYVSMATIWSIIKDRVFFDLFKDFNIHAIIASKILEILSLALFLNEYRFPTGSKLFLILIPMT